MGERARTASRAKAVFSFTLPAWLRARIAAAGRLAEKAARMAFVVDCARENVARGTGGPFAAAVFERDTGRLVAAGVNLVVPARCSVLHAEIVALALAQRALGTYNLGAAGAAMELVASAEPCAMCMGAIPWAGIASLVVGARGRDVEAAGFDEGAKPAAWVAAFRRRGIAVTRDVARAAAVAVLRQYRAQGGAIYNGGKRKDGP